MIKSLSVNEITAVIRAAHERTEAACHELLAEQVPAANIAVVHLSPFRKALKKSYELGLAAGRPWTLMVDADVMVRPGIIADLAQRTAKTPPSVFAIQTEMLDKFFGGQRVGGLKLYRTASLGQALAAMRPDDVRPEGSVNKRLHAKGLYVDLSNLVCGLHDFEQSYDDIFRKGFVHALKHSTLTEHLLPYWQRQAKSDKDFEVLMAGFKLGRQSAGQPQLAKDEVKGQFEKYQRQAKLKAKPALEQFSSAEVERVMSKFERPPEDAAVQAAIEAMGKPKVPSKARRLFGRFSQGRK